MKIFVLVLIGASVLFGEVSRPTLCDYYNIDGWKTAVNVAKSQNDTNLTQFLTKRYSLVKKLPIWRRWEKKRGRLYQDAVSRSGARVATEEHHTRGG